MIVKIKQSILFFGDIVVLYACLLITLFIRYGKINAFLINAHLIPFSIIFLLWLAIFYVVGLYDIRNLKKTFDLLQLLLISITTGTVLAITIFYLIPYFKIAPKTNLVIMSALFGILGFGWRSLMANYSKIPLKKVLLIGSGEDMEEFDKIISDNPQLGYKVEKKIESLDGNEILDLDDLTKEHGVNTVIINPNIGSAKKVFEQLYKNLSLGIEVVDLTTAYELILKKSPVSEVQKLWLITTISKNRSVYEKIKRPIDFVLAIILFIILFPLMMVIYTLIKITSKGPGIYSQIRLGKNEIKINIYKFRTMIANSEKNGPQWAKEKDPRTTLIGSLLRYTHLDELPQLINIIKGEVSFVGPRPERPEFVEKLKEEISYYDVRHLVTPGLTGWAQINYRYGSSVKDAQAKLQYDIYYIKHRGLSFDFLVTLKTIKMFFVAAK